MSPSDQFHTVNKTVRKHTSVVVFFSVRNKWSDCKTRIDEFKIFSFTIRLDDDE